MAAVSTYSRRGKQNLMLHTNINTENLKKEYLKQLSNWEQLHDFSELEWYQKTIDNLMNEVKKVKKLKEDAVALEPDQKLMDNTYFIITDKLEEVLVKKTMVNNIITSTIRVLNQDNCFEFILREHKRIGYSTNTSSLLQALNKKYMFPKTCLDIYMKSFNVCCLLNDNEITDLVFNKIGQLQVINYITTNSNTQLFQYLLIYVDKLTNFTILRPVMINTEEEISIELFKIFLEFGPPETLHIYGTEKCNFYADVFKRIKNLMPVFDIKWVINTSSFNNVYVPIMIELNKWMKETGSSNWEIGCYIVQWKLNSTNAITSSVDTDTSKLSNKYPYDIVFAKSLNSVKSKSESVTKPTNILQEVRSSIAHTSNQELIDPLSIEPTLPELDKTEKIAVSIEIMSDDSDSQ